MRIVYTLQSGLTIESCLGTLHGNSYLMHRLVRLLCDDKELIRNIRESTNDEGRVIEFDYALEDDFRAFEKENPHLC